MRSGQDERGRGEILNIAFKVVSRNLGWRRSLWRMRTEVAANVGSWPLQAAILKIKATEAVHSRQNQAARRNYESILGCHTLECREWALRTALCVLPTAWRMLLLVFTGSEL